VQCPDHRQRQASLSVENFGHARPRSENRLQLLAGTAPLLEAKQDRLDRVGRQDGDMGTLVGIDQGAEDIESVELGVPGTASQRRSISARAALWSAWVWIGLMSCMAGCSR
jgi:hypothetical protein